VSLVFISQHLLGNYREIAMRLRSRIGCDKVDHHGVGCQHILSCCSSTQLLASTTDRANRLDSRPVDAGRTFQQKKSPVIRSSTIEGCDIELQTTTAANDAGGQCNNHHQMNSTLLVSTDQQWPTRSRRSILQRPGKPVGRPHNETMSSVATASHYNNTDGGGTS
jgi:hypothetical protein